MTPATPPASLYFWIDLDGRFYDIDPAALTRGTALGKWARPKGAPMNFLVLSYGGWVYTYYGPKDPLSGLPKDSSGRACKLTRGRPDLSSLKKDLMRKTEIAPQTQGETA